LVRVLIPDSDDPFLNLALEENFLKNSTDDFIILGINGPSVIIGKHQSPHREVNTRYLYNNQIPVIRRITGGGTVYHDNGNINFSFIRQSESGKQVNFRLYTTPVIDFLASYGVDAKFEGKNDLKTDGFKISGNAEHVFRNRVLHHGTLLFNTSLDVLRETLRNNKSCYETRAVDSNPSHVMNLSSVLKEFSTADDLRLAMKDFFLEYFPGSEMYSLTHAELREAELLAEKKYKTWEWNFGYGPEYQFANSFEFSGKDVSCRFNVKDGTILSFIPEGSSELLRAAEKLTGCRHMPDEMKETFRKENVSFSDDEIFNFF